MPVQNLTKSNCSEEERFIFQYLEQKRAKRAAFKKASARGDDEDSDASIDDDEFDDYLDGLGGKADADEEDLDFLKDLGDELKEDEAQSKKNKKKRKVDDDEEDEAEGDWDFEEDANEKVPSGDDDDDDDG